MKNIKELLNKKRNIFFNFSFFYLAGILLLLSLSGPILNLFKTTGYLVLYILLLVVYIFNFVYSALIFKKLR